MSCLWYCWNICIIAGNILIVEVRLFVKSECIVPTRQGSIQEDCLAITSTIFSSPFSEYTVHLRVDTSYRTIMEIVIYLYITHHPEAEFSSLFHKEYSFLEYTFALNKNR